MRVARMELRLVAAGRSNRQIAAALFIIAAALFISEKTVANHLTAIFNEAGVDNRVAATAFAIRHGPADGGTGDGTSQ